MPGKNEVERPRRQAIDDLGEMAEEEPERRALVEELVRARTPCSVRIGPDADDRAALSGQLQHDGLVGKQVGELQVPQLGGP